MSCVGGHASLLPRCTMTVPLNTTDQAPRVGRLASGPLDNLGDVAGVSVGHSTLADGAVQTGVTVIRPHGGNLYRDRVPAAAVVINGFGKSIGLVQVEELGLIDTPIALTNTFSVPAVAMLHDAGLDPLFQAAPDCTEQAIVHALWHATSVVGYRGRRRAALREWLVS